MLFVHDDVFIDDFFLCQRLNEALENYDVIGLAGGVNPDFSCPTWGYDNINTKKSGAVAHVDKRCEYVSPYGETPKKCLLLDGCFIAVNTEKIIQTNVKFDPQFDFHFYDLDFCRTCTKNGLTLGTWPIAVTHSGKGTHGPEWKASKPKYFAKWKSQS